MIHDSERPTAYREHGGEKNQAPNFKKAVDFTMNSHAIFAFILRLIFRIQFKIVKLV